MRRNAGPKDKEMLNELSAVLMIMLGQFFSLYSSTELIHQEANLEQLLAYTENQLEPWENAQVAMDVTLALIQETQNHLPWFRAHKAQDCNAILNVTVKGDSIVQLEIEPDAFLRFTQLQKAKQA